MRTLLVRGSGTVPAQVRAIVRAGSTEVKEVRADEERDATTLEADRVVVWTDGRIEVRSTRGVDDRAELEWPRDEEKLRMFFQTGG